MNQSNIKNYFCANLDKSTSNNTLEQNKSVSDSESEHQNIPIDNCFVATADLGYYQDLLKKNEKIRKLAQVRVNKGISECWDHFGNLFIKNKMILQKYKFCKICLESNGFLKSFSSTTSTTNYISHLRMVHSVDVKAINHKKTSENTKSALGSSCHNNKFQNGRRVAEMCCWDLQPFKMVERPGFQKFVKFLNPRTDLPTNRTIATTALNDVYDVYVDHVKISLQNSPKYITLVTDMWSDNFKHISYINIKIHFCQNFEIKTITLKTEVFPRPHTASAVSEKINNALKEFNLENKQICAVTDGGSNIVAALKQTNILRFGCMAHTLHRFLMHDVLNNTRFNHINAIIFKLKKIYRSLLYSSEEILRLQHLEEQAILSKVIIEAENILESMDVAENYTTGDDNFSANHSFKLGSLKNSVPTRWNSLLKMVESFTKNINIINIALINANQEPLLIPEMEKSIIKEFGDFLKIFEAATQYLQGQSYPTLSTCIFFFESIMQSIEETEISSCFDLTINLFDFAKQNFQNRFKICKIHVVAALMDPSQKNWSILNKYLKKIPKNVNKAFVLGDDVENPIGRENLILEEIEKLVDDEPSTSSNSGTYTAKDTIGPKIKKQKITSVRQKMLTMLQTTSKEVHCLQKEIKAYLDIEVPESESLDWWKQYKDTFPNVAKLANFCFGIPATSASSEQAFSAAGNCVIAKRSSLHPATLKKQLFVYDNRTIAETLLCKDSN